MVLPTFSLCSHLQSHTICFHIITNGFSFQSSYKILFFFHPNPGFLNVPLASILIAWIALWFCFMHAYVSLKNYEVPWSPRKKFHRALGAPFLLPALVYPPPADTSAAFTSCAHPTCNWLSELSNLIHVSGDQQGINWSSLPLLKYTIAPYLLSPSHPQWHSIHGDPFCGRSQIKPSSALISLSPHVSHC